MHAKQSIIVMFIIIALVAILSFMSLSFYAANQPASATEGYESTEYVED